MYARPTVDQQVLSFGVSGKLWQQVLVLYDRQTLSLWSQKEHQAIAGAQSGSRLEVLGSTRTDWGTWKAAHPSTTVVVFEPRDAGGPELWRWASAAVMVVALVGLLVGLRRRRRVAP